jgi:hypothetical protein
VNNPTLPYFSEIQAASRSADGAVTIKRWRKTAAGVYGNIEHTYPDVGRPMNRATLINTALMQRTR